MVDALLIRTNAKLGVKVTVKTLISVCLVALAVGLPQLVHLVAGAAGGVTWLPMYLPVLLAGCLLGTWWGIGVGVFSPIVSFLLTSLAGSPMPALARLPFMIVELAVFAAVSGLFSKKIVKNSWLAFPAVLLASVAGRVVFLAMVAIFESVSPLSVALVWSQIKTGLVGLVLQAVIVPFVVMGLNKIMLKEKKENV
jgi:hypothetical protein